MTNEPTYTYVKGQGWVPSHVPGVKPSPTNQYAIMFRTPDSDWQNVASRGHTHEGIEAAQLEYKRDTEIWSTYIEKYGWEFEIWSAEDELSFNPNL